MLGMMEQEQEMNVRAESLSFNSAEAFPYNSP